MKNFVFIVAFAFLTSGLKAQGEDAKVYLVKSGHVEYELTGNVTGTRSVWWDNYGEWSYEEEKTTTKMKIFGMTSEEEKHTITVTKDGVFWTANMLDKTGMTGAEPVEELQDELNEMDEEELEQMGREMFDAMGGKELPPETFLGRKCQVMEIMGAKSYIYKNIPLKSTMRLMGMEANVVATRFEENLSIPSSKFKPIAGIDYEEMPDVYELF
jgi:hypothetical protein